MGRKVVGTADSLDESHPDEGDRVNTTAIAEAGLRRGAQKRLDQIEEIRDAHTLAAGGLTHREIANALLTSQPRVSRLLREGGSPEVGPEEVILRAAVDDSDRAALVQELSQMEYTFGEHDPTGGGGYRRGTWDDVQSAARQGLLTAEEYDAVLSAVVPTREDR